MKKKQIERLGKCVLGGVLAITMMASLMPGMSEVKADEKASMQNVREADEISAEKIGHLMGDDNSENAKHLIMPDEYFYIDPELKVTHDTRTDGVPYVTLTLLRARLELEELRAYDSKLVRSKLDTSKIITDASDPVLTNTYNIWKMGENSLPESVKKSVDMDIMSISPIGYRNKTGLPCIVEAIRGSGFDFVSEVKDSAGLTVANTVENTWSGCTLCFFEPYYLLTYKDVTEEESKNFPDRYYIKREKQEIRLPAIVRPGFHFKEWSGGLYFADKKRDGSDTVYTFDWENNIEKATYNWGDEELYPVFEEGDTITFHGNGGTIDGKEQITYELDQESDNFFDIGKYVPKRKGYTFLGWCYKPTAYYDSLIKDTSNYDWVRKCTDNGFDRNLYAKWAEDSDEELETKGYKLDEKTGALTIITDQGMLGWNTLCNETDDKCKEKVKSITIGGDVKEIDSWMFTNCENLETVKLSSKVREIGKYAFYRCKSLKNVEMPGVSSIYDSAFEECSSLVKVTFPDTIQVINNEVFRNCSALKEVVFEKEEQPPYLRIYSSAFEGCHKDLTIRVKTSLLKEFKEEILPDFADKITDEAGSIPTPDPEDPCAGGHQTENILTKATLKTDGKIEERCKICKKVIGTKTIAKIADVKLSGNSYVYDGKTKTPSVTVKNSKGKTLAKTDYSIAYAKGRKNVGSYTVTITLKNNYSGTVKKTFKIVPKTTSISKLTAGKKKLTVKWKKQATQTTGYQLQYGTSSKFKGAKTATITKNKTVSKAISKLKAKKKYYVRIRTYKTVKVNGKSVKLYSAWSKAKSGLTK